MVKSELFPSLALLIYDDDDECFVGSRMTMETMTTTRENSNEKGEPSTWRISIKRGSLVPLVLGPDFRERKLSGRNIHG
jgi:hypothetical protein